MVGYLNNKNRVLNEWYKLFIQKHHNLSLQESNKYWKRIQTLGFPETKNDNYWWKYPSLITFLKYHFTSSKNDIKLSISHFKKLIYPIDSYHLVFINGRFSPEFSDKNIDPWTLKIDQTINFNKIDDPIQPEMFLYLSEYLSNEVVYINLPTGKITKKPLYLLYINKGSNAENTLFTSHYFHNIQIGHNVDTCIIEHFVNANANSHFSGSRMSMSIGNQTKLDHIKLAFENRASYHISHHDIKVGQSAQVNSNIFIILGPQFTYHKTNTKIDHTDSSVSLNSLMFLSEKNIGDIRTYLEHNNQGYALSRQIHKIIACDCSIGVFNGLIKVNQGAIKTDGKMINNNLLLHKSAVINTIPKLEIYSDDVKCSHGATIGRINDIHLFYLRTRGIPQKDAIGMLVYAFVFEITETIKNTLLQKIILTKIDQALIRSTTK